MKAIKGEDIKSLDKMELFAAVYIAFDGDQDATTGWLRNAGMSEAVDDFIAVLPNLKQGLKSVFTHSLVHEANLVLREILRNGPPQLKLQAAQVIHRSYSAGTPESEGFRKALHREQKGERVRNNVPI